MGAARLPCEPTLNPQFSGGKSSAMVWSDRGTFQLPYGYFATFTTKAIADSHAAAVKLIALAVGVSIDALDATPPKP